jgi:DNA-binding CsgD family transcriptional regulator
MRRATGGSGTFEGITARELIDATPWPVLIVGSDRVIQAVNPAWIESLGLSREQVEEDRVSRRRIGHRMAPAEWEKYEQHLDRWFAGTLYPIRYRWPREQGPLDVLIVPSALPGHSALVLNGFPAAMIDALPRSPAAAHAVAGLLQAHGPGSGENSASALARVGDSELLRLTPRQWEIAHRISEGDRVTLLAEDLGISANTVRNHLKEIFRKLRVSSQPQLVRRVRRRTL